MNLSIDIKGTQALMRRLNNMTTQMEQELTEVVRDTALKIESEAKQNAPVDTGYMRNSITSDLSKLDQKTAAVSVNADYAMYVEMGTSKAAAQPFFRPAVRVGENYFNRRISRITGGRP